MCKLNYLRDFIVIFRENVISLGRNSGEVYFKPVYGHSRGYLAGEEESRNVVPLKVINSSFSNDSYEESEFISNRKTQDEDEEEDIYKQQLLLFLRQNNLLRNSSEDAQEPSRASSCSSMSWAEGSDFGL